MAEDHSLRRIAAFALMGVAVVAVIIFAVGNQNSAGTVVLQSTDCSVDPWSPACHHPSFMDMINGVGQRAESNANRQKKVKEQLLAQERMMQRKQAQQDQAAGKQKLAEVKKDAPTAKALKDTKYNGVDIASKAAVDNTMAELLKKGGKAAVEKKAEEIRAQVLGDSAKLFGFGKKAGFLPPPPAIKELTGSSK
mmetsp:Transcript_29186/g.59813  ORF Transcript_29186/g.59813 Transcript_29186/m.59813 type:complete len:194 (-) Transcript_29186:37-618(-)